MDEKLKQVIEEYAAQIESKEEDLVSFQTAIRRILQEAETKIKAFQASLDMKFEENLLTEEEFLEQFHKEKERLLEITRHELDTLVNGIKA